MKRLFLITLIVFFSLPSVAQQRWGGGVDYEKIHIGFMGSYAASSFKVFSNDDRIQSPLRHGVGFGMFSNLRLWENADLRFGSEVLFAKKKVDFNYDPDPISKVVRAYLLELPLIFKFKSDRRENYRLYLLGGGKYSRNIIPKNKLDDSSESAEDKFVKLKQDFFSYEFGFGVDIYFEYFKMSPEIKWSQSFGNVLDKRELNKFNTPIDKLLLRSIQFSLIFE